MEDEEESILTTGDLLIDYKRTQKNIKEHKKVV